MLNLTFDNIKFLALLYNKKEIDDIHCSLLKNKDFMIERICNAYKRGNYYILYELNELDKLFGYNYYSKDVDFIVNILNKVKSERIYIDVLYDVILFNNESFLNNVANKCNKLYIFIFKEYKKDNDFYEKFPCFKDKNFIFSLFKNNKYDYNDYSGDVIKDNELYFNILKYCDNSNLFNYFANKKFFNKLISRKFNFINNKISRNIGFSNNENLVLTYTCCFDFFKNHCYISNDFLKNKNNSFILYCIKKYNNLFNSFELTKDSNYFKNNKYIIIDIFFTNIIKPFPYYDKDMIIYHLKSYKHKIFVDLSLCNFLYDNDYVKILSNKISKYHYVFFKLLINTNELTSIINQLPLKYTIKTNNYNILFHLLYNYVEYSVRIVKKYKFDKKLLQKLIYYNYKILLYIEKDYLSNNSFIKYLSKDDLDNKDNENLINKLLIYENKNTILDLIKKGYILQHHYTNDEEIIFESLKRNQLMLEHLNKECIDEYIKCNFDIKQTLKNIKQKNLLIH